MDVLFRCSDGDYPLSEEEATYLATGLRAFRQDRRGARKIETRLTGADDTPVRLDDTERTHARELLDRSWLTTNRRLRDLYIAFARMDGLPDCEHLPFYGRD